jgi:hypothetical protein
MNPLDAVLNKGGAGKSLSRPETAQYLVPLVEQHNELIFAYERAIDTLDDRSIAGMLENLQPRNRADIQKLDEMIYSNGGSAPNGTDLDPEDFELGDTDVLRLDSLFNREKRFRDAVKTEYERREPRRHAFRTLGTLENVLNGSNGRLDTLEELRRTV